ncbi:hypothetical protein N7449_007765 [Penicillium cf. viridicatum]|uniref:Uncharacterized protein n=1 Tax=Penicillium cf. viridicatum TaxID=2972119 RepID=A0A9W9JJM5_9EURO|nr:hypothetical protein N7449_007765 [Penicillium cf. viridicatum]
MIPLKKGDQFSSPDMPDNPGDIIQPPPTSLYHTLTATCSVALMCLAPSIFTSQDYISDHLWKANIN